jgi:hypothetical protein
VNGDEVPRFVELRYHVVEDVILICYFNLRLIWNLTAEHVLYVSEDFYVALEVKRTRVFKLEQHFCLHSQVLHCDFSMKMLYDYLEIL